MCGAYTYGDGVYHEVPLAVDLNRRDLSVPVCDREHVNRRLLYSYIQYFFRSKSSISSEKSPAEILFKTVLRLKYSLFTIRAFVYSSNGFAENHEDDVRSSKIPSRRLARPVWKPSNDSVISQSTVGTQEFSDTSAFDEVGIFWLGIASKDRDRNIFS